ncbi:YbaK/EbsC family protein [Frigoribacterium sp. ACAM 257]|uniref:aminoacyl-tRNA deacylase n=1 Tax=Frigoribacterium sp. ACAM 257 TaxID=2508998 RepID=UPI0011B9F633|nr:YbaK/EbsC family protein [Frigoribacterium sp. ACAM 257]TWX40576.1 YbaK/EbsC family protein [Frigoribacterium sp. ACAM 257]
MSDSASTASDASPVDDAAVPDAVQGPGTQRLLADAAQRGLPVEIVARPAADSLEAAAALLGVDPSSVVKSLVVKRHDGSFLFALVPGNRQISWRKLRTAVGVNKLSMPTAEVALDATGFERGTITPIGSSTAWPVVADERIVGRRVAMGAGGPGLSAFVEADDLVEAYSATVADISD